jgi:hypothetical protein
VDASPDLSVHVLHDRDIVIVMPETSFEVTYRRDGKFPVLVAIDAVEENPGPPRLRFLVLAWKLAYQRAKTLGWLNS